MAIFLDSASRVIVQGMTGTEGTKHTGLMLNAGTRIVGGVNPRKAGGHVDFTVVRPDGSPGDTPRIPVFGTVAGAMAATGANVSVVFVPPAYARDAVIEAADAAVPLVVVITEGIPVGDAVDMVAYARARGTRIIGPNCPGIITPGGSNVGITPANITGPGPLGLVSKSGTLTYQLMHELRDVGFSTCLGIGGDPVVGTTHIDALAAFEADPATAAIVMIGEIGGDAEERAAQFMSEHVTKPVVAYIAGFTAPEGKTMGHAGAIVSGGAGTARAKAAALGAVGVRVGTTPRHTADLVRSALAERYPT
ncbi:MAG: succinate--CoA ligase subunit alpha [Bifidobacteriaceae bacterium]|jgi:succinyl-CoA synthetase alpha subunit|nr:succinate--CoA ligase subunit alpha [Bifidobacteriaceae bacterium]